MKKIIFFLLLAVSKICSAQEKFNVVVNPVTSYNEDFSSNSRNWPQLENDSVAFKIINGEYNLLANKSNIILPQKVALGLYNKQTLWRLSAEVTYLDGNNSFGIFYGTQNAPTTFSFMITGNGDYVIVQNKGKETKVLAKGKSSKINTGKGAKNMLSIETDNDYLFNFPYTKFCVNGSNVIRGTKAEQAIIDAEKEAKNKKNANGLTNADFDDMFKESELSRVDPESWGDGKIGIMAMRGTLIKFDNIKLETKENKGRMIMYNNRWKFDPELSKYLAKNILVEENAERIEVERKKIIREVENLSSAKSAIEKLSPDLLSPYGNTVAAGKPDVKTVAWLSSFLLDMEGLIVAPFFSTEEKEVISATDTVELLNIKHYFPDNNYSAKAKVNLKTRKAECSIPVAEGLSKDAATLICSNYLVNLAAAFDRSGNKYFELDDANKQIPRSLLIAGEPDIVYKSYILAYLDVIQDKKGGWSIILRLIGK